jgi:hypothetical protein
MQRSFYFLIVGAIVMLWVGQRLRLAYRRLGGNPSGGKALDMRVFGYSAEEAKHYLALLGEDGRRYYLKTQTRLELPFIIGYGLTGAAMGAWLSAGIQKSGWSLASWVPLIGGLLVALGAVVDLDEGQAIRKLIRAFPRLDAAAVARSAGKTRLKFALLFVGAVLVLAGMVVAGVAYLKS